MPLPEPAVERPLASPPSPVLSCTPVSNRPPPRPCVEGTVAPGSQPAKTASIAARKAFEPSITHSRLSPRNPRSLPCLPSSLSDTVSPGRSSFFMGFVQTDSIQNGLENRRPASNGFRGNFPLLESMSRYSAVKADGLELLYRVGKVVGQTQSLSTFSAMLKGRQRSAAPQNGTAGTGLNDQLPPSSAKAFRTSSACANPGLSWRTRSRCFRAFTRSPAF